MNSVSKSWVQFKIVADLFEFIWKIWGFSELIETEFVPNDFNVPIFPGCSANNAQKNAGLHIETIVTLPWQFVII